MTTLFLKSNESIDSVLRRFKRLVENSRALIEVKERRFYRKPCEIRNAARAMAISRTKKRVKTEAPGYIKNKKVSK